MTRDDRGDAQRDRGRDGEGEAAHGTGGGAGPGLGGLFDGLPESGRSADPGPEAGTPAATRNPFRLPEPAREETGPYGTSPTSPTSPAPSAQPRRTGPPPTRPNVIPFRGTPAESPDGGAASDRTPAAEAAAVPRRDGAAHARQDAPAADPVPQPQEAPAQRPPSSALSAGDILSSALAARQERQGQEAAGAGPAEPEREREQEAPEAADHAYAAAERAAVYRVIRERRDVRTGFRPAPVPDAVLIRLLEAAHQAPSVGYSQPWDFLVIQDGGLRTRVRDLAESQRAEYARALPGARAQAFSGLKTEAILDTPLNIAVTVDPTRGGRHTLGRHSQPQTAAYSAALAVENIWLAARAEGLGIGWVSFFEERELAGVLGLPPHLEVVAYLCVGYVEDFPPEPELSLGGWAKRRPLSWAVHRDRYGRRGLPGEEPASLLEETITAIAPLDAEALDAARDRQDRLTKPPGSLGVLEDVAVQLCGLAKECPPPLPEPAAVAVFAADHGVHAQGVTSWPQEVTAQMVHNFLRGGAVVNAFAAQVGAEVTVVDMGVAADLPAVPGLLPRKIARGTADITQGPAMTRDQALTALETGIEVARDLVSAGNRCLVTGDMGIANTTSSAALIAAFTGADPQEATGRGTGVDDAMYKHKVEVVRRALEANEVDAGDPVGVLAGLGGLEHAAIAGFVLGAAALRVPVLLDGVIAGSAALAAAAIAPDATGACFAGHRSSEPGHALALEHLGLRPLVDLEMRLGEGSGALMALPLLQAAARALRDVATFDSAGVSER